MSYFDGKETQKKSIKNDYSCKYLLQSGSYVEETVTTLGFVFRQGQG